MNENTDPVSKFATQGQGTDLTWRLSHLEERQKGTSMVEREGDEEKESLVHKIDKLLRVVHIVVQWRLSIM